MARESARSRQLPGGTSGTDGHPLRWARSMHRTAEASHGAFPRLADGGPARASALLTSIEWQAIAAELRLSARELQIAHGFLDGLDEHGVAAQIGISEHTVHSHLQRLYRKIDVNSRCEFLRRMFVAFLTTGGRGLRDFECHGRLTPRDGA